MRNLNKQPGTYKSLFMTLLPHYTTLILSFINSVFEGLNLNNIATDAQCTKYSVWSDQDLAKCL